MKMREIYFYKNKKGTLVGTKFNRKFNIESYLISELCFLKHDIIILIGKLHTFHGTSNLGMDIFDEWTFHLININSIY